MIEAVKSKEIIIFGAGSLASKVIKECEENNILISYILDNDPSKQRAGFEGYVVKSPEEVKLNERELIVIASSYSVEIQKQLRKLGLKPQDEYINFNLLFPYVGEDMKFPGQFTELREIGEMLSYSIDDVGVLLKGADNNFLYRAIYHNKEKETSEILNILENNGFYDGLIIKTEKTDKKTRNFNLILKHPYLPYCSDSRSWSFTMINDGFKAIILLLTDLHKDNLTLKDAHGLNLTLNQGKYKWIDFGSIVKGDLQLHVLRQYVEWFLFPCILMVNGQARYFYEHNYYGGIRYFMIKSFLDKEGEMLLEKLYKEEVHENMYILMETIFNWSERYFKERESIERTMWENYQEEKEGGSFSKINNWSIKQRTVINLLKEIKGNTLLDIAGNNGWYCMAASKHLGMSGLLVDYDHKCIDKAYKQFKKEKVNFIPLVNDFRGFPENVTFMKEHIKFDGVLCLAFIHHLVFSNGFTFERVRDTLLKVTGQYLIIEFIEPTDEFVSTWMNQYFTWYNMSNFEAVFNEKYTIISKQDVSSTRIVYLMQLR